MKGECGCVLVCRVGREKSQERAQVGTLKKVGILGGGGV